MLKVIAPPKIRAELRTIVLLFALAASVAMVYTATWGGLPQYWQNTTFMQGIMWVCGHGFYNPMVDDVPGLAEFVNYESDCFDCGKVPDTVRLLPNDTSAMTYEAIEAYHPQEQFPGFPAWQRYHLYLVWTVTFFWWIFGLSWSALTPLCGLLYGASAIALYGVFRLGMRRPLATVATLILITSPLHLQMVPHIRDYAKAPFMLALIFLIGLLITRPLKLKELLGLAALGGILLGIGIGFRTDLGVGAPAFLIVILFFLPGPFFKTLPRRLSGVVVFVLAFSLVGYPILVEVFRESGHFCHVTLLGFLDYCCARLGVEAPLYQFGGPYTDYYLANTVQSYMQRVHGSMPPTYVMMPAYHEATQLYFKEYLQHFPADAVLHAYAAILRVIDELHINPQAPWPAGITHVFLQQLFSWREALLQCQPLGGRYWAAAALLLLAAFRLRWGLGAIFVFFYFAGYTGIQYNTRHAFHLEFMSLWASCFLLQALWNSAETQGRSFLTTKKIPPFASFPWKKYTLRLSLFLGIALLGTASVVGGTRLWQQRQVYQLALDTLSLPRERLEVLDSFPRGTDRCFSLPGFELAEDDTLPTHAAFLLVQITAGEKPVSVTLHYDAENTEHYDYTRSIQLAASKTATQIFVPIYFHHDARFVGIGLPEEQADRLEGIYRLKDADRLGLWITWRLNEDWESRPHWQEFTR